METANRYEILSKLAIGGMAEIFLARSTTVAGVARYVVLKRILNEYAKQPDFVQMFLDEARLASQLQHPNIAQVFDVGRLGDSYFFTMEYVHGETLRTVLQHAYESQKELAFPFILTVVAGTGAGLHHAHDRVGVDGRALGIVHRDISPANIMVGYEGSVKVVDFGVAKATTGVHETRAGTVKGKVSYMSPEQCRGNVVDRRTDLFALGICAWELITRGRLYRRQSDFDSMAAIVNEEPPPPSAYRKGVPREIDRLVLALLEKDPGRRPQTGEDLVEEIEAVATKLGMSMNPSAVKQLLRDFFGKKPEPWQGLDPKIAPVTLTATPPRGLQADDLADGSGSEVDLYSAIEIAAAVDVPAAPTARLQAVQAPQGLDPSLFKTIPRTSPSKGLAVDDLLKTFQNPPVPKSPPPDMDFDQATTRDLGSPLSAQIRAAAARPQPDDAFDNSPTEFDEDPQTLRDEPGKFGFGSGDRKTMPMSTVAPPKPITTPPQQRAQVAPANIIVSPSIAPHNNRLPPPLGMPSAEHAIPPMPLGSVPPGAAPQRSSQPSQPPPRSQPISQPPQQRIVAVSARPQETELVQALPAPVRIAPPRPSAPTFDDERTPRWVVIAAVVLVTLVIGAITYLALH